MEYVAEYLISFSYTADQENSFERVERVSSSKFMQVGRSVRTQLCALGKCDTIEVDMINPKDWSNWVRGSIALYAPPKNSWGCAFCQMKFVIPSMLCGTLVLRADSSQMLVFGLSLEIQRSLVSCPYNSRLNRGLV